MLAAKVVGTVVATRKDPSVEGKKILMLKPMSWQQMREAFENNQTDSVEDKGKSILALDSVGAGAGEYVFYVGSREACHAFEDYPISYYAVVGIIDGVSMQGCK